MSNGVDAYEQATRHRTLAKIAAQHGVVYLPGQLPHQMPRIAPGEGMAHPQHQQAAGLLSALARGGIGMNGVHGQGLLAQPQQAPPAGLLATQRPAATVVVATPVKKGVAKKSSGKKPAATAKKSAVRKSGKPAARKRK